MREGHGIGEILVPAELVQRAMSRKCVAIVGAGPSRNVGIPGWRAALKKIVKWAGDQGVSLVDLGDIEEKLDDLSADLLMIAAELSDQLGKTRYRQALTAVFRPIGI